VNPRFLYKPSMRSDAVKAPKFLWSIILKASSILKSDLSDNSILADSYSRSAYIISFKALLSSFCSTLSKLGGLLAGENSDYSLLGDRVEILWLRKGDACGS